MFRKRLIPCLLRHNRGLVKTVKFKNPVYLGDPFNVTRLFNEKAVDELMLLDIDASVKEQEPDYDFIENLASECFMPLCYGGGIKTIDQIRRVFALGVEKVALSSALFSEPELLAKAANIFGSQSIIAVLDAKKNWRGKYMVHTYNGSVNTSIDAITMAKAAAANGSGELVINNIDLDGNMAGYDLALLDQVAKAVTIPVIALGGAGSLADMKRVLDDTPVMAAAAGSLFVFSGVHRAVLINYPQHDEIRELIGG